MLRKIQIRNFLTIEYANIDLSPHLTTIIGESGSGKSLILKAISVIFAQKTDTAFIGQFEDKSIIKLLFSLNKRQMEIFGQYGIFDDEILIEKVIQKKKAKSYINHEPVNAKLLNEMQVILFDMVSQDYKFYIFNSENILNNLDKLVDNSVILEYKTAYKNFLKIKSEQNNIQSSIDKIKEMHPEIMLDKIDKVNPKENEYERLNEISKKIKSSALIKSEIGKIVDSLYENDDSIESKFYIFLRSLDKIAAAGVNIKELKENFEEIYAKINSSKDSVYDLLKESDSDFNIDDIESRLFKLEELQRKFSKSINEILKDREKFKKLIEERSELQFKLEKITEKLHRFEDEVEEKANKLSLMRRKIAKIFETKIKLYLSSLMLKESSVEFEFSEKAIDETGKDSVRILFSANPDIKPLDIEKIASGGERSRFILSLMKSILNIQDLGKTVFFDEIESGMGKESLQKMSEMISGLSKKGQIVLITHNEQLAKISDKVFKVEKSFNGTVTKSFVNEIGKEDI